MHAYAHSRGPKDKKIKVRNRKCMSNAHSRGLKKKKRKEKFQNSGYYKNIIKYMTKYRTATISMYLKILCVIPTYLKFSETKSVGKGFLSET